jgi:hypothetical protein
VHRQRCMRWTILLLIYVLAGCQGWPTTEHWNSLPRPAVMPLWESYQHCLTTTDPVALHRTIEQLEQVAIAVAEPPQWLTSWGNHVVKQPLRASVDPRALGAACTLRAASVMVEIQRLPEAQALYQRVLTRYQDSEMAYYRDHAKDNLATLSPEGSPLLALRSSVDLSR